MTIISVIVETAVCISINQSESNINCCCFVFVRNSDRLGNGVLYASVNPEYFSAAESACACVCDTHSY